MLVGLPVCVPDCLRGHRHPTSRSESHWLGVVIVSYISHTEYILVIIVIKLVKASKRNHVAQRQTKIHLIVGAAILLFVEWQVNLTELVDSQEPE